VALSPGTRLGPYEIIGLLGAGGMGEVYKAQDGRLNRPAAIKVLPAHLKNDPERRERFLREARAVASLVHPHICVLHDIGLERDVDYLVMEYLEGDTLARRLEKGPLPIDQVLRLSLEIGSALDKAHRQGIVHRDLKPGNIMLTKSGAKLLDFGLAKLRPADRIAGADASATRAAPLTIEGSILGTLQYMAPEQLEGREVDSRTDIFAFGAIVYEMATGAKAFTADSQAGLIAAVLERAPAPICALQPTIPRSLDDLVARCLAKDPDERWQTATDLTFGLEQIRRGMSPRSHSAETQGPRLGRRGFIGAALAVTAAIVLAGLALLVWGSSSFSRMEQPPVRLLLSQHLLLPTTENGELPAMAISNDGQRVVYVAQHDGRRRLFLREMKDSEASLVAGTENAMTPFFSPDGQRIGFFADGYLKTVATAGGAPVVLANVLNPRGGTWGTTDTIIYSPSTDAGLWRVSARGGAPQPLVQPDPARGERGYRWPAMLPGDDAVVFVVATSKILSFDDAHIAVRSLRSGEQRELVRGGSFPVFMAPDSLLYARAGALLAIPFDPVRLAVTGTAQTVLNGVITYPLNGGAQYALASNGTLVHLAGSAFTRDSALTWVDRKGVSSRLKAPSLPYNRVILSPDGQRAALDIDGANASIWILDLQRPPMTRLTLEWSNNLPFWTPDGTRIGFISARGGRRTVFWQAVDGRSEPQRLVDHHASDIVGGSFAPDGKTLIYEERHPTSGSDLWVLSPIGTGTPRPFLQTSFNEQAAQFAPDGRWVAYVSDVSGRNEVYVQSYPDAGSKLPVSTDGGTLPVWASHGRELFYWNGNAMMSVKIQTSPVFSAAQPEELFQKKRGGSLGLNYALGPDGRFLMIEDLSSRQSEVPVTVTLNWRDDVQRRLAR
jgi:serine/threonine protein kinase/Tol biopolymer transport system component